MGFVPEFWKNSRSGKSKAQVGAGARAVGSRQLSVTNPQVNDEIRSSIEVGE